MIPPIQSFEEAFGNLQRFMTFHAASLPEHTLEHLFTSSNHPSPVDRMVNTVEALYAAKSDLGKEGRDVLGQMAQFVSVNGFHGMADRGRQINYAMNRMGGYTAPPGIEWQDASEDPEPLERFVEKTEPAPAPTPPPTDPT